MRSACVVLDPSISYPEAMIVLAHNPLRKCCRISLPRALLDHVRLLQQLAMCLASHGLQEVR